MEDEDSESKVKDMWNVLGEQQFKDTPLGNTLKPSIESTYTDAVEEENQLLQYNSVATKDSSSKNNNTGAKIVFKGFKKRILAQTQEIQTQEQQSQHCNASLKSGKEKRAEIKRGKITEYAQYLGLQPSSKNNKCSKCNSPSNSCSTLKQNLCNCNATMTPMPSTSDSSMVPHSPNFKITRKVYLCAACGTYFENWNLFLHMRDIHKRHICLFCLGMFGQAERLSYHLTKKHSVPELAFTSIEDFYGAFKGSCYLVCCTCEKVFSETDNFYNHFCSSASKQDVTASICTLCRQTGSHASTCSLAISTNNEINSDVPTSAQMGTIPTHTLDKAVSSGNKTLMRKPVKNNRSKHIEDGVLNQQKVNTHIKKTNDKIENESSSKASSRDDNLQNEVQLNIVKDTVSETIMEVSKYIEDSSEEREHTNETRVCERDTEEKLLEDTVTRDKPYDSITETIMEVSRCTNSIEDPEERIKKEDPSSTDALDAPDKPESSYLEAEKLHEETLNASEKSTVSASELSLEYQSIDENVNEDKTVVSVLNTRNDGDSDVSENQAESPVNRSLFSPQHESHLTDAQSKEETDENESIKDLDLPNESQSSMSFNAVASTDRSLVIKICTNRNSQFSITSANNDNDMENLDVSKESEEKNSTEDSLVEEKEYNEFEKDQNNGNGYEVNNDDSDSDSLKLAVVDTNVEEAEEIQETAEARTVSEIKSELDVDVEENEDDAENSLKEITASVNISENKILEIKEESREGSQSEMNLQYETQAADGIILAGEDVPCIDFNVEGTLDSTEIEELLKRCIEAASPICVYCNHARHIAVNGKQLGLHMLAEHKFQPQHPAIIIQPGQFIARVKKSLDELDCYYFNLDSYSSTNGTYNVPDMRIYECFHCRFHSAVHKELYLHNRKMHQKTILICIMCKSTFYSYSELLCHLCPGAYSPNINVKYRCCLCPVTNLPSAFRLMVHLRKKHHACDVCLESTGNQQRLSNHVWKHKLHHLCYRCGIAYRNKPDITKHLFWKHGTESVLCKKCLQKKWPHIYHFCIPPTAFVCEECGSSFTRAVALKVHKRLHTGDQPYPCSECFERFISRKLLAKHENAHKEPPAINVCVTDAVSQQPVTDEDKTEKENIDVLENTVTVSDTAKETKETVKKVVDVYDLPPLNLSSESDTDSENEKQEIKELEDTEKSKPVEENTTSSAGGPKSVSPEQTLNNIVDVEQNEEEKEQGAQIMDGIWDNFKSYTASLEKKESVDNFGIKEQEPETDVAYLRSIVLADHDYCVVWSDKEKQEEPKAKEEGKEDMNLSGDQECLNKAQKSPSGSNGINSVAETDPAKKKSKSPKKKKQGGSTSSSDSSSDSDSSSCSCGTNCSCSSSSSGSSSSSSSSSDSDSSTSESSPRKSSRKERRKEKEAAQEPEAASGEQNREISMEMENGGTVQVVEPVCTPQLLLRESDLETEETETDEDFYDEHPQQLANKLLAEKRNQLLLLAAVAPASTEPAMPLNNGLTEAVAATPSPDPMSGTVDEQPQQKRKMKTKKRKKGERTKQRAVTPAIESIKLNIPKAFYQKNPGFSASSPALIQQSSAVLTAGVSANDMHTMNATVESQTVGMAGQGIGSGTETENKRSSKRKRIPKKFYGDSSDEDADKQPTMKWRKTEAPSFATMPSVGKPLPPRLSFGGKTVAYRPVDSHIESMGIAASATESEEPAESSSDSSDSEVEASQQIQTHIPEANVTVTERPVNLYCYCQCPYDEVSEMIACDGEDCRIEWFHFECVGIMVPPKGKWYCPDCRKKYGIVQNSEDYFD